MPAKRENVIANLPNRPTVQKEALGASYFSEDTNVLVFQ